MVCGAHLFVLSVYVQAGLEPAMVAGRDGANFSQCSAVSGGFLPVRGSGCHRV
jgi:hypothetical protein